MLVGQRPHQSANTETITSSNFRDFGQQNISVQRIPINPIPNREPQTRAFDFIRSLAESCLKGKNNSQ